jgi:hypothetical protein
MPCSSPPRLFSAIRPRVRRIRGGDWRSLDARGHPIVFKSRKLDESERLYPIYDKEMLAIMHALTKFK